MINKLIDQKKNFSNNFGTIYRSSAIFYIPKNIKTTISISNYWEFKNNVIVGIVVSIRKLNGKLYSRYEKNFKNSNIINLSDFGLKEGSIEIEAYSNTNLRIPYAAIMCIYEGKNSINMVHTYARNHSITELEENKAIINAKESCWTIKSNLENKAVFHNGHLETNKQKAKIILTNQDGSEIKKYFNIPTMKPFATYIFELKKIFPEYKKFFKNEDGFATLHFNNNSSFTRLLLIWSTKNNREFQTTHSNFDYSKYITNKIKTKVGGEMTIPEMPKLINDLKLIVYPKFEKSNYLFKLNDYKAEKFNHGFTKKIDLDTHKVTFSTDKDFIPSRIVTGITAKYKKKKIPFECSMGINHINARKKRFGWALVSGKHISYVHINKISIINNPISKTFIFKLYNSLNKEVATKKKLISLDQTNRTIINLKNIFKNYKKFLGNKYGYITIFNEDSSIRFYTSLYDTKKGMTIEHAF